MSERTQQAEPRPRTRVPHDGRRPEVDSDTAVAADPVDDASPAIVVRGARVHNLRDIHVEIPRDSLTVVTGLSGSGKSSLAFDTIYAEGQRRYVESLSAYARQFLGVMEKPDVDQIEGLSPAIAIEQRTAGGNPRSTVGTVTEIYDYLRLLWARAGTPHCPSCGDPVRAQSASQIAEQILDWPEDSPIEILAPLVRGRKGGFRDLFERVLRDGFVRARVDGDLIDLAEPPTLNRRANHDIAVVVDRLVVRRSDRDRLADSIEIALRMAEGTVEVDLYAKTGSRGRPPGEPRPDSDSNDEDTPEVHLFSEQYACPVCGINIPELEPRQFSFNSPYGACPECDGLGVRREPNPELMVGGPQISILEGVLLPLGVPTGRLRRNTLPRVAEKYGFDLNDPWRDLDTRQREAILLGDADLTWEGAIAVVLRRYRETGSDNVRAALEEYMALSPCRACEGGRLRPESRAVTVEGRALPEIVDLSVAAARELFHEWLEGARSGDTADAGVRAPILKEVAERLEFMDHVGLGYLTLGRSAETLSGGEAQRIRLATQIGSRLVGVLYVLDEPSIGLHPRDNQKLLETLATLRDLGNTVLVVEHDEQTITSLTAGYLRGDREIPVPARRRSPGELGSLIVRGAREHNLRDVDVEFPLGLFTCVTGVSGSGKSTLVEEILYRRLARQLYRSRHVAGDHDAIEGIELIDKVIDVDQSPIGRTPRSNPATYTGLFTPIRDLYSKLPESRLRGYAPGRFSFNVKGGRCEACRGDGLVKIEMHFLPDVYVPCDVCRGRRYNRETLEVLYKGKSIADVLEMTVEDALEFFDAIPVIQRRLGTLADVGLGYVTLGQSATTLSGGEAQRVKLATELAKIGTGRTLYILDEPTTGLHFEDVRDLLAVLHRLADKGNTILVIEHHLDVIKTADWVIDLGPEGGAGGGTVVAQGPPESIVRIAASHTGRHLADVL